MSDYKPGDYIRFSEDEQEALERIRIDTPDGRVDAYELICGMQNALNSYQRRVDNLLHEKGEQLQRSGHVYNEQLAEINSLQKTVASLRSDMAKLARKLANAGESDHRRKNEVILWVIARLLYIGETPPVMPGNGGIPF